MRRLGLALMLLGAPIKAGTLAVMCQSEGIPLTVSPFGGLCEVGDRLFLEVKAPGKRWIALAATGENGTARWFFTGKPLPEAGFVAGPTLEEATGETLLYVVVSDRPLDQREVREVLKNGRDGALLLKQKILIITG